MAKEAKEVVQAAPAEPVKEGAVVGVTYGFRDEQVLLLSKSGKTVFFISPNHGMCQMSEELFLSQWKRVR